MLREDLFFEGEGLYRRGNLKVPLGGEVGGLWLGEKLVVLDNGVACVFNKALIAISGYQGGFP